MQVGALRQVVVDVPRTAPGVAFVHEPVIQKCLERLLYIWGVRHPASGYVQVRSLPLRSGGPACTRVVGTAQGLHAQLCKAATCSACCSTLALLVLDA